METSFLPLLFGGDINVYSMARAFHEAYGIRSTAYGKFPTGPCYQSDIIDYRPCRDIESDAVFVEKEGGLHQFSAPRKEISYQAPSPAVSGVRLAW